MQLPAKIEYLLSRLTDAGFAAYVVGGCVRDALAGRTPHDYDVCTAARPEQVHVVFADHAVRDTGLAHGTVTVVLEHEAFEITTFRVDGAYSDSRHPDSVTFTEDIALDLARRDFTINAMAFHPAVGLVDPFGGRSDLRAGLLRCVGAPRERFSEDALRILRALRFSARFGYAVEESTAAALRDLAPSLAQIAPERVKAELDGLLVGRDTGAVLRDYPDVLGVVLPEILPCVGFDQHNPHHIYDVWEHTLRAVDAAPPDLILRWTMLLHDLGKPAAFTPGPDGVGHFYGHARVSAAYAGAIFDRLRFSNAERGAIGELIRRHDGMILPEKRAVRRLLGKIGRTQFDRLLEVRRADNAARAPELAAARFAEIDTIRALADEIERDDECTEAGGLAVNGRDLIARGYAPGPLLGAELKRLLDRVLDDPALNEKNTLLRLAEEDRKTGTAG